MRCGHVLVLSGAAVLGATGCAGPFRGHPVAYAPVPAADNDATNADVRLQRAAISHPDLWHADTVGPEIDADLALRAGAPSRLVAVTLPGASARPCGGGPTVSKLVLEERRANARFRWRPEGAEDAPTLDVVVRKDDARTEKCERVTFARDWQAVSHGSLEWRLTLFPWLAAGVGMGRWWGPLRGSIETSLIPVACLDCDDRPRRAVMQVSPRFDIVGGWSRRKVGIGAGIDMGPSINWTGPLHAGFIVGPRADLLLGWSPSSPRGLPAGAEQRLFAFDFFVARWTLLGDGHSLWLGGIAWRVDVGF